MLALDEWKAHLYTIVSNNLVNPGGGLIIGNLVNGVHKIKLPTNEKFIEKKQVHMY